MISSNQCIVYYDSLGAHFIAKPSDKIVKTGSTVTFVWIYETTGEIIEKGELMTHINGNDSILFKVIPPDSKIFVRDEYLKRVNITIPVALSDSRVSAQMVLSNVTTADTGFYSFKVLVVGKPGDLSNVSLYVTGRFNFFVLSLTS